MTQTWEEIEKEFAEFGAIFALPANAMDATGHVKGLNGEPQLYSGKYSNEEIKRFWHQKLLAEHEWVEDAIPKDEEPCLCSKDWCEYNKGFQRAINFFRYSLASRREQLK